MADLTSVFNAADPTLEAIDEAIEAMQDRTARPYLGMSAIGGECERALWYSFRFAAQKAFKAKSLKAIDDGHRGEDLQAARLRMVNGIELYTADPQTGKQFGCVDHGGHFKGHLDGAIHGLLQAPKTWHVWEHKQVNEKKFDELVKLKIKHDEKEVFAKWDTVYFVQAQLYMHYTGMKRHYLTVNSPGGRRTTSVRTEYDPVVAERYRARAERIIFGANPPPKLSEDPTWHQCKPYGELCAYHDICHGTRVPAVSCRTCCFSTPEREGTDGDWSCSHKHHPTRVIPIKVQRTGCNNHLPLPFLVKYAEPVDAGDDWILFKRKDNERHFVVVGATGMPPVDIIEKYGAPGLYHSQELSAGDGSSIGDPFVDDIKAKFGGRVVG